MQKDFEAGMSLRDIAKKHGIGHIKVQRIAKENGWTQLEFTSKPIDVTVIVDEDTDIFWKMYTDTVIHYQDAMARLAKEGDIINDPKFGMRVNPLFGIVEKLKGDPISLRKLMGKHDHKASKETIFDVVANLSGIDIDV